MLCSHHHHLVPEGGYRRTRNPTGGIDVRVPPAGCYPPCRGSRPQAPNGSQRATPQPAPASETLPPHWNGDRLHLNYAVGVLLAG
ncbi:MAG: hypothetical protein ABIM89_09830 [Mycobacteriales bacterium]